MCQVTEDIGRKERRAEAITKTKESVQAAKAAANQLSQKRGRKQRAPKPAASGKAKAATRQQPARKRPDHAFNHFLFGGSDSSDMDERGPAAANSSSAHSAAPASGNKRVVPDSSDDEGA